MINLEDIRTQTFNKQIWLSVSDIQLYLFGHKTSKVFSVKQRETIQTIGKAGDKFVKAAAVVKFIAEIEKKTKSLTKRLEVREYAKQKLKEFKAVKEDQNVQADLFYIEKTAEAGSIDPAKVEELIKGCEFAIDYLSKIVKEAKEVLNNKED